MRTRTGLPPKERGAWKTDGLAREYEAHHPSYPLPSLSSFMKLALSTKADEQSIGTKVLPGTSL